MKKNYTHVSILIDASSSMFSLRESVISGINNLIEEQKKIKGEATVSLAQFAGELHQHFSFKPLNEVGKLEYSPVGNTALIDSFVKFIDQTGEHLSKMKESDRPENVVMIVFTDGEENGSHLYTSEDLKKRVETQKNEFSWKFIFLGANIDAFAAGQSYGTKGVQAASGASGVRGGMGYSSALLGSYRSKDAGAILELERAASVDDAELQVEAFKKLIQTQKD